MLISYNNTANTQYVPMYLSPLGIDSQNNLLKKTCTYPVLRCYWRLGDLS